jgi:hypothetical protein
MTARMVAGTSPVLGNESVIVGAGLDAGATRDDPFESSIKADAAQRPVAPSGGDAIRGLMRSPMMPAVFGVTRDGPRSWSHRMMEEGDARCAHR